MCQRLESLSQKLGILQQFPAKNTAFWTRSQALLGWLAQQGAFSGHLAQCVKELRRQQLAPKGLKRPIVRRLLREGELREDTRVGAIFGLLLYTGTRVGDVVNLDLADLTVNERSGWGVFKHGKGNKQRTVPLTLPARRVLLAYLESRPPVQSSRVFIGGRGPPTERDIQCCVQNTAPHWHSPAPTSVPAHDGAPVLARQQQRPRRSGSTAGHESLNTTNRYCKQTQEQLAVAAERLSH